MINETVTNLYFEIQPKEYSLLNYGKGFLKFMMTGDFIRALSPLNRETIRNKYNPEEAYKRSADQVADEVYGIVGERLMLGGIRRGRHLEGDHMYIADVRLTFSGEPDDLIDKIRSIEKVRNLKAENIR